MLSSRINYASLLSTSAPESNRVCTTIPPNSGSSYDSTTGVKAATFLITPSGYLDAQNSYVRGRYRVKTNVASAFANADALSTARLAFDGSVCSAWRSVILQDASGSVITQIENFPEVAAHRIKAKGGDFQNTIAANMMGYSQLWDTNLSTSEAYSAELAAGADTEFPGSLKFSTGSTSTPAAANDVKGELAEFCIPLYMLSGLFDSVGQRYIPTHLMSSRTHALALTLNMATAENALVFFQGAGTTSPAQALANANRLTNYGYTIDNLELVCEWVDLGAAQDSVVRQAVASSGISIMFPDWVSEVNQGWAAGNSAIDITSSKLTLSMKNVTAQIRPASYYGNKNRPTITASRRNDLQSVQFKIGTAYYPAQPIYFLSDTDARGSVAGVASANPARVIYNGTAYAEYIKSTGSLSNKTGHGLNVNYHLNQASGFEVGADFSKKDVSDAVSDETFIASGRDTKTAALNTVTQLKRYTTTEGLSVCLIFEADNMLILQNGQVKVSERL